MTSLQIRDPFGPTQYFLSNWLRTRASGVEVIASDDAYDTNRKVYGTAISMQFNLRQTTALFLKNNVFLEADDDLIILTVNYSVQLTAILPRNHRKKVNTPHKCKVYKGSHIIQSLLTGEVGKIFGSKPGWKDRQVQRGTCVVTESQINAVNGYLRIHKVSSTNCSVDWKAPNIRPKWELNSLLKFTEK